MSKENQKKEYDGQNRCRRCDRPLIDPNDIYGWRCEKIVGFGSNNTKGVLDGGKLLTYNDFAVLFEGIRLAEDIVNPKDTGIIKAVKEIWRYYKE